MKLFFRSLCKPLLNVFEKGDDAYAYKPLNRKILVILGLLLLGVTTAIIYSVISHQLYGYMLPAVIFGSVSLTCLIVGLLGTERAVANIWGNK